jgi:hypothetical protein
MPEMHNFPTNVLGTPPNAILKLSVGAFVSYMEESTHTRIETRFHKVSAMKLPYFVNVLKVRK